MRGPRRTQRHDLGRVCRIVEAGLSADGVTKVVPSTATLAETYAVLRRGAERRVRMIRTALAERLGRPRLRQLRQAQKRPRFPCLTWTASIVQGQVLEMGVHGALFRARLAHELGWTAEWSLRPRGNARSLRKPRAPGIVGKRREAAAASLKSQAERGAMGGDCSC